MLQYTFPAHSQLFLLTCLFFSLTVFQICCNFSPTCQPKMSSLAYLQSILSSSLSVSDSCLHTASYTRLCSSSQYHPAFPGSPLRDQRSARGRRSHVLCEDGWQKVVSLPCLPVLSHQYFFPRYCRLTGRTWCLMLQDPAKWPLCCTSSVISDWWLSPAPLDPWW